jgi:hypothetical protein
MFVLSIYLSLTRWETNMQAHVCRAVESERVECEGYAKKRKEEKEGGVK